MKSLFETLNDYCDTDTYPFHMPGHKRNKKLLEEMYQGMIGSPYAIDITEIDGFDNLHHAEGVLKEAQERAARCYKAKESFFLINGSTCGLIAAIYACTEQRGAILMARNCHKAVYHAAELRELKTYYLFPEMEKDCQLNGRILPEDVKEMLEMYPEISAVLITSPTYDGIVSDVKTIAEIVHQKGKVLIVDEAHGAHFGFSEYFPENSLKLGGDVVVHSIHKTLPSFTQTALLSVAEGSAVEIEKVRRYLGIFETSSPSYVMMAGMDQCIRFVEERKEELFTAFQKRLDDFYLFSKTLEHIRVIYKEYQDPSKIVIFADTLDGNELAEVLRSRYHLEIEMAAKDYVIALTSIFDTEEGFERLKVALAEIDRTEGHKRLERGLTLTPCGEAKTTIAEALKRAGYECKLEECEGKISREYIYLYPPGIPLVVPGEVITGDLLKELCEVKNCGFELQGMRDYSGEKIDIIDINQ